MLDSSSNIHTCRQALIRFKGLGRVRGRSTLRALSLCLISLSLDMMILILILILVYQVEFHAAPQPPVLTPTSPVEVTAKDTDFYLNVDDLMSVLDIQCKFDKA